MKKILHTPYAPAAIGTYNQAVQSNGFIYTAGQVGIVPGTGKIIEGGIKSETFRALQNIDAILKAANSSKLEIVVHSVARAGIWAKHNFPFLINPIIGNAFRKQLTKRTSKK